MLLSKGSEYAIKATIYIASRSLDSQQTNLNEIADAIGSPIAYTAKILQLLVKNQILTSTRGVYGGFKVNQTRINTLNLLEIVLCVDGSAILTKCVLGLNNCSSASPCPLHSKYSELRQSAIGILQESSIKTLANQLGENNIVLIN